MLWRTKQIKPKKIFFIERVRSSSVKIQITPVDLQQKSLALWSIM